MVGQTVGSYEVIAPLGAGGMGLVFLAEHQRIARRAAVKVLAPEFTGSPDALKRFFMEARATSLIRHPGIVEVFDCDVDANGCAYIVMEYLEGETLAAFLHREGAVPGRVACAIGKRIADALAAAHSHAIVHRDLKPGNIFLSTGCGALAPSECEIKVLDFGIAKLLSGDAANDSLTRTGAVLGTPAYIAPEQCNDPKAVDQRTDVYALGCILFEMICGSPPFPGADVREVMVAHMFQAPPSVAERVASTPPWLSQLIDEMLAKHPSGRPQSMIDVARVLSQGDPHEGPFSLSLSPRPESAPSAEAGATPRLPVRRADRRGPPIKLAYAVGVLSAVVGATALVLVRSAGDAGRMPAAIARPTPTVPSSTLPKTLPEVTVTETRPEAAPSTPLVSEDRTIPANLLQDGVPLAPRPVTRKRPDAVVSSGNAPLRRASPPSQTNGIVDL